MSRAENVEASLKPNTRMIYCETPSNPTMVLTDLAAMSAIAKKRSLTLVADNTFLSPYLQNPLALGVHIVVHSMTKYLNGHSDSIGGAVVLSRKEDAEKIYFLQRAAGAILGPMDCFLISRGIKTLAVRMDRHDTNGRAIAQFLESHAKVKRVLYPGLASHPQHELAKRQQRGFGAMISFDVGSLDAARSVLNNVRLCALAESLGGVETLISHPPTMTHSAMPPEVRLLNGITDGLIRLSAGIEDLEDLLVDLDHALAQI
jgi:cystathionine beta-lyase/cystathionine gamma-synthase